MSQLLLADTSGHWNLTGEPVRADGWYGAHNGHHTITIHVNSFLGRLHLEACLVEKPTEADWFPVNIMGQPYLSYPRGDVKTPNGGETSNIGFNVQINAAWFRIRLDRSHMAATAVEKYSYYGSISKVLLA